MRNVEIKARVRDMARLRRLAAELSGTDGQTIVMSDTFFPSAHGRLKLRRKKGAASELIFYDRPDCSGPKLSQFSRVDVSGVDVGHLEDTLGRALGVRGHLHKTRHLYLVGQTRVHVDQVQGLGDFMELEVQLTDAQTVEEGQRIAERLMTQLEVSRDDLLTGAYMDILDQQNQTGDASVQNGQGHAGTS